MTIEYAAIWRAWLLAQEDMSLIRLMAISRTVTKSLGGLGVVATAVTPHMISFVRKVGDAELEAEIETIWERA